MFGVLWLDLELCSAGECEELTELSDSSALNYIIERFFAFAYQ